MLLELLESSVYIESLGVAYDVALISFDSSALHDQQHCATVH
jgi:hypothetical protein